jgi:ammonium transporter, Amt family
VQSGDVAWMLISTALVVFMVPGLAVFYGGMMRSKSILNMIMMNLYCLGVVAVLWVLFGYSLSNSGSGGLIGNLDNAGLRNIRSAADITKVAFLMTFAVITPALISGAVADRMKFSAWAVFVPLWVVLVYCPITYWMYHGWLGAWGALDFAGGTVIHINAGVASLALVLVLGNRRGWPDDKFVPHNLVLMAIGGGILWFGWFGFNAGSAGAANEQAARAALNTFLGGAAGLLGWLAVEKRATRHFTTLGAVSGAVAGLAAITPAAGYVGGLTPLVFGFVSSAVCFYAVRLKDRFRYDDSLDVVGVHMVAGLVGGVLLGLLADRQAFTPEFLSGLGDAVFGEGALTGGGFGGGSLFWNQLASMAVTLGYSFGVTFVLATILKRTMGLRVDESDELSGLDRSLHAESAYN